MRQSVPTLLFVFLVACGAPPVEDAPLLPLTFAHEDHTEVSCIACHHDFVDDSGPGLCIDCHKRDARVAHQIEEQFHGLCRGCHAERLAEGKPAGPTRGCNDCHVPDALP